MDEVISFEFDADDIPSTCSEDNESNASHHNYRYEIDPVTGSVVLLQDEEGFDLSTRVDADNDSIQPVTNYSEIEENQSYLKVLESGETVLVTHLKPKQDQEKKNDDLDVNVLKVEYGGDADLEPEWMKDLEAPTSDNTSSDTLMKKDDSAPQKKKGPPRGVCSYWSREKVDDLLQCIQKHARQLRKKSTVKMKIWNDIARDLRDLGHINCNRDECAKKWSNMLRTAKLITLKKKNPAELRRQWPFFDKVSRISHLLSLKDDEDLVKKVPRKDAKSKKSRDLIKKLLEQSRAQQEALEKAEAEFQIKMHKLDQERDEILRDIKALIRAETERTKQGHVVVENQSPRSESNEHGSIDRLGELIGISGSDLLKTTGENMLLIALPDGTNTEEIVSMFNAA